ncbi:MAG: primosomal protein N' [Coriobacteriales bacterium]|jgi:primosomal protein N' (replication factor Y)|nr:primosomal protein N' [Coriobacteriales bacterium]
MSNEIAKCDDAKRYAQIVLDIQTRALDSAYDYEIPLQLAGGVQVGCSVLVEFANRPALGYVVGLSGETAQGLDVSRIKPVRELLSSPLFEASSVELAFWISREYLAPLSDSIRLFTPPGGTAKLKKDTSGTWTMVHPQAGPVDDRWVYLNKTADEYKPPKNAMKQRAIIETLRFGEMRVQDLALSIENPAPSLQALERHGVVTIEHRQRVRGRREVGTRTQAIDHLTPGQKQALETVNEVLDSLSEERRGTASCCPATLLLDGVTGSGKTEVYLQAISRVLDEGGSACVLVPEISLTPQTVSRFRSRFGEEVAVLHSRLSAGERFDQWELVRSGKARVVVGARSALFAPLKDLRLIVIDEEHESTYKQGSKVRYVSRDVAIKRAELCGAAVILGSATPSLESLHAAGLCSTDEGLAQKQDACPVPLPGTSRSFIPVVLPERVSGRPLPPVEVVDLAAEFHAGNRTMYSYSLRTALLETMERGEKAVLLLNKRGFVSVLLCRDCGYVPTCEQCDTSLTLHKHPAHLLCHYCDGHTPVPSVCPECGSPYLRQLGPGTQYAADQLTEILPPNATLVRMDADTTRLKDGHEKRLEEFAATRSGVLLGTQMIAKGLDFSDVTLVGVLLADVALKFPDFRASERTWQLLEQVAGRAGRAEKDGRVIVQTYWPEHVAIQAAARHDRSMLLAAEYTERAALRYPPFGRLANILVWGKEDKEVREQASRIAEKLRPLLPDAAELLGPSPCVVSKRQGLYRWHVLIKAPPRSDLPGWLGPLLKQVKPMPGVSMVADIDPQDML